MEIQKQYGYGLGSPFKTTLTITLNATEALDLSIGLDAIDWGLLDRDDDITDLLRTIERELEDFVDHAAPPKGY